MKSILFIIAYFGTLPEIFQVFLDSCKYNDSVDFLLFTDDSSNYSYPANVTRVLCKFENIKNRFQQLYDFSICLDSPYKLCDYKVAYGEAFSEYLKYYDYWGYCDIDLIWGNIRKFLTDDILESYCRVLTRGHCSIYRNDEETNSLYRTLNAPGCHNYKEVFTSPNFCCFDEWGEHCGNGLSVIFQRSGIPQYDERIFADPIFLKYGFKLPHEAEGWKQTIFEFDRGALYAQYIEEGQLQSKEFMYLHLQKRKIQIDDALSNFEQYVIATPNKLIIHPQSVTFAYVKKHGRKNGVYPFVIKFRINQLVRKASNILEKKR